jgi:hypothetical protein
METQRSYDEQNHILPFYQEKDGCYVFDDNNNRIFWIVKGENPLNNGSKDGYTLEVEREHANYWFEDGKIIIQRIGKDERIEIHFDGDRLHIITPANYLYYAETPVVLRAIMHRQSVVRLYTNNVIGFPKDKTQSNYS